MIDYKTSHNRTTLARAAIYIQLCPLCIYEVYQDIPYNLGITGKSPFPRHIKGR